MNSASEMTYIVSGALNSTHSLAEQMNEWKWVNEFVRRWNVCAACRSRRFGNRCRKVCSCPRGLRCHHVTGDCLECPPGFSLPACTKRTFAVTYGEWPHNQPFLYVLSLASLIASFVIEQILIISGTKSCVNSTPIFVYKGRNIQGAQ